MYNYSCHQAHLVRSRGRLCKSCNKSELRNHCAGRTFVIPQWNYQFFQIFIIPTSILVIRNNAQRTSAYLRIPTIETWYIRIYSVIEQVPLFILYEDICSIFHSITRYTLLIYLPDQNGSFDKRSRLSQSLKL